MESDTFHGNINMEIGNLIYQAFSVKTPDNL